MGGRLSVCACVCRVCVWGGVCAGGWGDRGEVGDLFWGRGSKRYGACLSFCVVYACQCCGCWVHTNICRRWVSTEDGALHRSLCCQVNLT